MARRPHFFWWTDDDEIGLAKAWIYVKNHNNIQAENSFWSRILATYGAPRYVAELCAKWRDLKNKVTKFNQFYVAAHAELPRAGAL